MLSRIAPGSTRPQRVVAERIAGQALPPRKEVFLRYVIGKYCDDVEDFDRAFDNFRRANQLMRTVGALYDRRKHTERIDRIIQEAGLAGPSDLQDLAHGNHCRQMAGSPENQQGLGRALAQL